MSWARTYLDYREACELGRWYHLSFMKEPGREPVFYVTGYREPYRRIRTILSA
jgi:hypothetical protein